MEMARCRKAAGHFVIDFRCAVTGARRDRLVKRLTVTVTVTDGYCVTAANLSTQNSYGTGPDMVVGTWN